MTKLHCRALELLLFFSGMACLIYEITWVRLLGFTFGNTTYAISTVAGAFMLGLAVGAFGYGRIADRSRNPLRLYGMVELGIGFYCLFMPQILDAAAFLYIPFHGALSEQPANRVALQFLVSFSLFLLPCTLMGATLPAASRALISKHSTSYGVVPSVYAANLAGAAIGTVVTGFFLLEVIGIRASHHLAASVNMAVGLAGLFLSRGRGREPMPADSDAITAAQDKPGERHRLALLLATFLSGAVAMSFEIVLLRSLTLQLGHSVYAFTAILFSFLLAIGVGSFAMGRFKIDIDLAWVALAHFAAAAGLSVFIYTFDKLPFSLLAITDAIPYLGRHLLLTEFLFIIVLLVPLVIPFGVHFAMVTEARMGNVRKIGDEVGSILSANTLGALAGSLLCGFVAIPALGVGWTVHVLAFAELCAGVVLYGVSTRSGKTVVTAVAACGTVLLLLFSGFDPKSMTVFGGHLAQYRNEQVLREVVKAKTLLYAGEDINSTATLYELDGEAKSLWVNGKPDASNFASDMDTQTRLAYTPLLLHPNPERVMVVGLGSGITAGTVGLFREVKRIESVELSRSVVEAARYFDNFGILDDSRSTVRVDDARSYLTGNPGPYDVIISEPPNPWIAGTNNLFTHEFMELVQNNLADGGIFCQWLHIYGLSKDDIRMVARTISSVFPEVTLWRSTLADDLLFIGAKSGFKTLSVADFDRRYRNSKRLSLLFNDSEEMMVKVFSGYLLSTDEVVAFAGEGEINTDDLPLLEFSAARNRFAEPQLKTDKDILSFKRRTVPPNVVDARFEEPSFPYVLGLNLLQADRYAEARWEFERLPKLLRPLAVDPPREITYPLQESFGKESPLVLSPKVGLFQPDDDDERGMIEWEALETLMESLSGVETGMGRDGGRALVIRSVPGIQDSAVSILLPVRGGKRYEIEFDYDASAECTISAGLGVLQFDRWKPTRWDFGREEYAEHEIGREFLFTAKNDAGWHRGRAAFTAAPDAKAADLRFLSQECPGGSWVVDNLTIREKEPEKIL